MTIPSLCIPPIPIVPAGLPSGHTNRSIRMKQFMDSMRLGAFEEKAKSSRSNGLSPREQLMVKSDREKYTAWTRKWERDRGVGRYLILSDFVEECRGMSKAQLENMFGNASELVFIHIYTFLRWNCRKGCSIALQLRALRVFFDASSGFCYAFHFLKTGGSELLQIFFKMQDDLTEEDMTEVINTYLSLTAHGPKAQEYIMDTKLVDVITKAIPEYKYEGLHKLTVMLFVQLAEGNLTNAEIFLSAFRSQFTLYSTNERALHTAAHIYRILNAPELAAACDVKNTIDDFLVLSAAESTEVQQEGLAIFHTLIDNVKPIRRRFIFDTLIDLIGVNLDELSKEEFEPKMRQQTFALRLLLLVARAKKESVEDLCTFMPRYLPVLVRAISNTDNFAAQKTSCLVIASLSESYPNIKVYLMNAMPQEWVQGLLYNPHNFCLQLTPTQVDTFQSVEPESFFFDLSEDATSTEISQELARHTDIKNEQSNATIIRPVLKTRMSPFIFEPYKTLRGK